MSGPPRELLLRGHVVRARVLTCRAQRNRGRHPQAQSTDGPPGTSGRPPPLTQPFWARCPFSMLPFSQVRKREAWQSQQAEGPQPAWLQSPRSALRPPAPRGLLQGCGGARAPRGRPSARAVNPTAPAPRPAPPRSPAAVTRGPAAFHRGRAVRAEGWTARPGQKAAQAQPVCLSAACFSLWVICSQ